MVFLAAATAASTVQASAGAHQPHNLLWLLDEPTPLDSEAPSSTTRLFHALNITLAADHIVVHSADGSDHADYNFFDASRKGDALSLPLHSYILPADAEHFFASKYAPSTISSRIASSSSTKWHLELRPAPSHFLALKSKASTSPQPSALHDSRWLLTATSSADGKAKRDLPLLQVDSYCITGEEPHANQCSLDYSALPVARHITFSPSKDTVVTWESNMLVESSPPRPWHRIWNTTRQPPAAPTRSDLAHVLVFGKTSNGAYRPLSDRRWTVPPSKPGSTWRIFPGGSRLPDRLRPDRMKSGCRKMLKALQKPHLFKNQTGRMFSSWPARGSSSNIQVPPAPAASLADRALHGLVGLVQTVLHGIATEWKDADGPKQTFMAIIAILQVVWLACTVKGWLDDLFGRKQYRNRRTKSFARRAAMAAAGGSTGRSGKPGLPPRPSAGHALFAPQQGYNGNAAEKKSASLYESNQFVTTATGEIVLPSWTETGPTPLMVIVEEPELETIEDGAAALQPGYRHEKKCSDWDRMAGEWDEGFDSFEHGWIPSNQMSCDKRLSRMAANSHDGNGSLRYRERREAPPAYPFFDEAHSLPSTPYVENTRSSSDWHRGADAAEVERSWRDSCLEEGVMETTP